MIFTTDNDVRVEPNTYDDLLIVIEGDGWVDGVDPNGRYRGAMYYPGSPEREAYDKGWDEGSSK